MKKIIITSIIFILLGTLLMGCGGPQAQKESPVPEQGDATPAVPEDTAEPQQDPNAKAQPQASVPPKLTGEATDAPSPEDIEDLFGVAISTLILKDTLEYELPLEKPFAVALSENSKDGMRWLLISDDGKYQFIQEMPMDGYRAFLFEPLEKGEDYVVFELVQHGAASIETLSFQLFLGTAGGD